MRSIISAMTRASIDVVALLSGSRNRRRSRRRNRSYDWSRRASRRSRSRSWSLRLSGRRGLTLSLGETRIVQRRVHRDDLAQPRHDLRSLDLQGLPIERPAVAAARIGGVTTAETTARMPFRMAAFTADAEESDVESTTPARIPTASLTLAIVVHLMQRVAVAAPIRLAGADLDVAYHQELNRNHRQQRLVVLHLPIDGSVADRILLIPNQVPVPEVEQIPDQPRPIDRAEHIAEADREILRIVLEGVLSVVAGLEAVRRTARGVGPEPEVRRTNASAG